MVVFTETFVGIICVYQLFEKCYVIQIKFIWIILDLFMVQYYVLVLFGVENHHMAFCIHSCIFACIYCVCDFVPLFYV